MNRRNRTLQWVLAVAIAIALVGVIALDFGAASPGPLTAVHHAVAELRGAAGCATCHGAGGDDLANACNECHSQIGTQLTERRGLHGDLAPAAARRCGSCHTEHRGRGVAPVGDRAFVHAGVGDGRNDYQHEGLQFRLNGKHDTLDCVKCHEHADAVVLPPNCKRFLGLHQDCTSCHDDPHDGQLAHCAECHGQERPFAEAARFEHDPRVPLEGSHKGLTCKECHAAGSEFAIEALGARGPRRPDLTIRTCEDCHASRHDERFLAAVADAASTTPAATCTECHDIAHKSFLEPDEAATQSRHEHTGMSLTVPHDELACNACHTKIGTPSTPLSHRERFPGRDGATCTECHESSHDAGFLRTVARLATAPETRTCQLCHGDGHRDFRTLDDRNRDLHRATGFPLEAPHDLACDKCHQGIGGDGKQPGRHAALFPGRDAKTCTGCHEDPHRGQFARGELANLGCKDCHAGHSFLPPSFDASHHALTRFALTGAHRAVGCSSCHTPAKPGTPITYADAPTTCNECHADVHDGAFDRTKAGDCARCHDTESFRLRKGQRFDHDRWTKFALVGRHRTARCDQCHPKVPATHGGTRTFGKALSGCADCHTDPHARQFAVNRATDCAKCHTPEGGFDKLLFDHSRHARFKLDGQHKDLACNQCHKSYDLPKGGKVVRYKPLGTKCIDCHGWRSTAEYERQRRRLRRQR